ncbi:MAG: nuclear transport factor 2 family protein [Gemmatimonadales bacterium]|nr:nuclear transport factor 2 family protein [Gemmatimonadales bacterium]
MRLLLPILCAALLTLPSAALGQDYGGAKAAIHQGTKAWMAGWNAGDAAAVAALYAEDGVVMAPGAEPAKGRAAIEALMNGALEAAGGSKMEIKPTEVMESDGMAVEVGTFAEIAADGSHRDHGRYMAIWKKVDGKWMLYRDIWNSSM